MCSVVYSYKWYFLLHFYMWVYIFIIDYIFVILKYSPATRLATFVILIYWDLKGIVCIVMVPTTEMRQQGCTSFFPLQGMKSRINFCSQNVSIFRKFWQKIVPRKKIRSFKFSDGANLSLKQTKVHNRSLENFLWFQKLCFYSCDYFDLNYSLNVFQYLL